jgi:hypothetical protein
MKLKNLLNEVMKKRSQFPEFAGESNNATNDLADQFVTTIEDDLESGITMGTLNFIDYQTSDESDPSWIANSKWYYDLARYMKPKGDKVTILPTPNTPAIKLTFDERTQNINWETLN